MIFGYLLHLNEALIFLLFIIGNTNSFLAKLNNTDRRERMGTDASIKTKLKADSDI